MHIGHDVGWFELIGVVAVHTFDRERISGGMRELLKRAVHNAD
jgi:hypothetical protein